MDLSVYYQTTATLVPVFLLTISSAARAERWVASRLISNLLYAAVVFPAIMVELIALRALMGAYDDPSSPWIVFGCTMWLLAGTILVVAFQLDHRTAARDRGSQPHSQPHKPDPTARCTAPQLKSSDAPNRVRSAETEPEATGGRQSL